MVSVDNLVGDISETHNFEFLVVIETYQSKRERVQPVWVLKDRFQTGFVSTYETGNFLETTKKFNLNDQASRSS